MAALILEFRGLNTLISTFTSSLAARADSHGRVHTNFKQMSTRTGRFSSSKPNLQNIPVRTEDGRRIREAFIAAAGYDLLVIDYSQIELRLLAHFSRDPTMIGIYMRDEDIHQNTADALGIDRRDAKPVNFGIIYGLSTMKLAKQLRVSEAVAEGFMRGYYNAYPGVALFQSAMKEFAHKHGYTDTIIGRRRYLPDLKSGSYGKRTAAERMAVNTRVQGSAADLVKIAMRNVDRRIVAEGWRRDVHMLSQVHDELIFEVKREMIEEVGQAISWEMENCVKLRVPLVAKPSSGPSWAAAK